MTKCKIFQIYSEIFFPISFFFIFILSLLVGRSVWGTQKRNQCREDFKYYLAVGIEKDIALFDQQLASLNMTYERASRVNHPVVPVPKPKGGYSTSLCTGPIEEIVMEIVIFIVLGIILTISGRQIFLKIQRRKKEGIL